MQNNSISQISPNFQFAWDSTSIGAFKTCPRYYQLSILEGWQPRETSVHLIFGLHFHSALELYDHLRFGGMEHRAAMRDVVRKVLALTWDEKKGRPWLSDDPNKNRVTLLRSVIWYLDQFGEHDPIQTVRLANGKPAVELSFRFDSGYTSSKGESLLLCGHLDRLAMLNDKAFVLDRKTTKSTINSSFFDKFTPDNQMSLYAIAGKIVYNIQIEGIIVDGAQVAHTFTRFLRGVVPRSESVLEEWYFDLGQYLATAELYAAQNYWPQNDKSCLTGDTEVSVTRGSRKGWKMSIAKLHDIFHGVGGARLDRTLPTFLLSDVGGHVANQQVLNVFKTGTKPVYLLKTDKGSIKATADHEFKTQDGWKRLDQLQLTDVLLFWDGRKRGERKAMQSRVEIGKLYYYPKGRIRDNSTGLRNRRKGAIQRRSVLAYEAHMNGLSLDEFVEILRWDNFRATKLKFLPEGVEVHHRDGNPLNDEISNLEALTVLAHKQLHPMHESVNRLTKTVIESITFLGEEEVYDISMEAPHHNFIANGFVAHNCGMYGGCPFRKICGLPASVRQDWLKADFSRRIWDPLQVRGDI